MKRTFLYFLFLLISSVTFALDYEVEGVTTTLNVRECPSINCDVIDKLSNGDVVRFISEMEPEDAVREEKSWIKIEHNGLEGWVVSDYLKEVNSKSKFPFDFSISSVWDYFWTEIGGFWGKLICVILSVVVLVLILYFIYYVGGFFLHFVFSSLGGCLFGLLPAAILGWLCGSWVVFKYIIFIFAILGFFFGVYLFWKNPKYSIYSVWEESTSGGSSGGSNSSSSNNSDDSPSRVDIHTSGGGTSKYYDNGGGSSLIDTGTGIYIDKNGHRYNSDGFRLD